ncbi:MAG: growth inhibitor [bacterium]|nr:MAG: growth inhibitor [bacterium]
MLKPGDIITVDFLGAASTKRRPTVVVSTELYHKERIDVVLAVLTTNLSLATCSTDHVLQDWNLAGLHSPTAFRPYLSTFLISNTTLIGHLSDRDWQQIQIKLKLAIAT